MNVAGALSVREGDREQLRELARSSGVAPRALIVLLAADGMANTEIARVVGTSRPTVLKWRHRYEAHGLAGLVDEPRPGRPTTIDEVEVLGETLADGGRPPAQLGVTHWSARLMADRLGISFSSVARIWRKHDIRPNRLEGFTFSTDPALAARLDDVVALYLSPHTRAVIVSSARQSALRPRGRTERSRARRNGSSARRTQDYLRGGTAGLFTALAAAVDKCTVGDYHRAPDRAEFSAFLDEVLATHPDTPLHAVVDDDHVTHTQPAVRGRRVTMHFVPAGRPWLTVAGIFFGVVTRQAIRRGVCSPVDDLDRALGAYAEARDEPAVPFKWVKNGNGASGISDCKSINNTRSG